LLLLLLLLLALALVVEVIWMWWSSSFIWDIGGLIPSLMLASGDTSVLFVEGEWDLSLSFRADGQLNPGLGVLGLGRLLIDEKIGSSINERNKGDGLWHLSLSKLLNWDVITENFSGSIDKLQEGYWISGSLSIADWVSLISVVGTTWSLSGPGIWSELLWLSASVRVLPVLMEISLRTSSLGAVVEVSILKLLNLMFVVWDHRTGLDDWIKHNRWSFHLIWSRFLLLLLLFLILFGLEHCGVWSLAGGDVGIAEVVLKWHDEASIIFPGQLLASWDSLDQGLAHWQLDPFGSYS